MQEWNQKEGGKRSSKEKEIQRRKNGVIALAEAGTSMNP